MAATLNYDEAMSSVRTSGLILFWSAALAVVALAVLAAVIGSWSAKRLRAIELEIAEASKSVMNTSETIKQSSSSLAESVDKQSSSVLQTASALNEIKATIEKNLESVNTAKDTSMKTKETVRVVSEIFDQLDRSMNEIMESNKKVHFEINESNEEIRQIMKMISSIKDKTAAINEIVFQTKLLSFNASVEAARAGEHGKGFSVVAEEVGKLAAMSGHSATEINQSLEESAVKVNTIIQNSQDRINQILAIATRTVEEGAKITRSCSESLRAVPDQVESIHLAILEISRASDEQARGISEISNAMSDIDQSAQENLVSSQEAKDSSEGLNRNAHKLNASVVELNTFISGDQKLATEDDSDKLVA